MAGDCDRMIPWGNNDRDQIEIRKFFRVFLWYVYSEVYNWKSLAYSIYHLEHLINHLDNYQIRNFIQPTFRIVRDYFILFLKDLMTIEIQSSKRKYSHILILTPRSNPKNICRSTRSDYFFSSDISTTSSSEINQIEQHIEKLKDHFNRLKNLILTTKERLNLCRTDLDTIEILLHTIEDIHFDSKLFDQRDQNKIHFLSLQQNLAEKSTKTDLMQMKIYIDNQMKNLIELNKENARELERIKLLKTSTCQARYIQSILSIHPSSPSKPIYPHQTSRPYITFELDHIRKYQRQALILKSPYGTIPLYRRQAWAAANLFPNHSLHFLRYMQNSLRMQIHDLIGYDPSDICQTNKKKKKTKRTRNLTNEIVHRNEDVLIMGNNNQFYRGRIDACERIPLKKGKEKKLKIQTTIEQTTDLHLDQFDQSNQKIIDEHLFEYLDWQIQFNEQDLPDELCEELFDHWTSIVCHDQPCHCENQSKLIDHQSESLSINETIYNDRCICSQCSCYCEKDLDEKQSICLCSECSCECLKDIRIEHEDSIEDVSDISQENFDNELTRTEKEMPVDQSAIISEIHENEIMLCDCFLNRIDRWTEQFALFSSKENDSHTICNSLELDDPTSSRQHILDRSLL